MSDETRVVRMPAAIAQRLASMPMEERAALIVRALSAPAKPVGETPVAGVEPEVTVALPERGELVPGLPGAGSPSVASELLRLPPDCAWFLRLDDTSRADAVRRSLARFREIEAVREVDLMKTELDRLREIEAQHERPANIPDTSHWVGVVVWVPRVALVITSIQDVTLRALKAEISPSLHDPDEVFQTEDAT